MLDNRKMSIAIQQLSHINLPLVRSVASSIERGSETKIQNLPIQSICLYLWTRTRSGSDLSSRTPTIREDD